MRTAGRREGPGRPLLYATTPEFLSHFGLGSRRDLPGIAEPAIQQGRYVAKVIRHRLGQRGHPGPFRYADLGTMATVSRLDAVADIRGLHLQGPIGKLAWAGVHVAFLVGWPNRLGVLTHWAWTLATGRRRQQVILRPAGDQLRHQPVSGTAPWHG